ncbi:uncharacterized protein LOC116611633 [Nematostella vectensis]|uniref:uncharacterized protein LOC116611633 n=1 Tax=Nematostella vectensis TaxID=45351 RepID=UPI0020772F3F|nr:uncharacterized protein LOC116611633 [Nematostella vectensis]
MAAFIKLAAFAVCLCSLYRCISGQTCAALPGTPLEGCMSAGYNKSFPLPSNLSKRSHTWIRNIVEFVTTRMQNCSVASVSETIACAVLAPNCRDGDPKPFLPCRRVCSEFLKRCNSRLPDYFVDLMIGMCSLLPNSTADTGMCYEPPQFDKHYNVTNLGPLERGCQRLIFPFCQDLGYTHSVVTEERQKKLFRIFYGFNYTNPRPGQPQPTPLPRSRIQIFQNILANYSSCQSDLKKIYCAELMPPCFPGEEIGFYTACKDVCRSIVERCPSVFSSRKATGFLMYCERLAEGNSTHKHGYCQHISWPPPLDWANFREYTPNKRPSHQASPTAVIVVSIVVPIVVVGLVLLAVFLYKRRKLTSLGYSRQEDDRADLVT